MYQRLAGTLDSFLRRRQEELIRRLTRLTLERHQRFQNTIFHLEPNLKDGPGGLRDYQMIRVWPVNDRLPPWVRCPDWTAVRCVSGFSS